MHVKRIRRNGQLSLEPYIINNVCHPRGIVMSSQLFELKYMPPPPQIPAFGKINENKSKSSHTYLSIVELKWNYLLMAAYILK